MHGGSQPGLTLNKTKLLACRHNALCPCSGWHTVSASATYERLGLVHMQGGPQEAGDGAKRAAALQSLVQNLMDGVASPDDVAISSYPLYDDHAQVRTALQAF